MIQLRYLLLHWVAKTPCLTLCCQRHQTAAPPIIQHEHRCSMKILFDVCLISTISCLWVEIILNSLDRPILNNCKVFRKKNNKWDSLGKMFVMDCSFGLCLKMTSLPATSDCQPHNCIRPFFTLFLLIRLFLKAHGKQNWKIRLGVGVWTSS